MLGAFRNARVGVSSLAVAAPACLLRLVITVGCVWALGLFCVMKAVVRLLWNPRISAAIAKDRKRLKEQKRERRRTEDEGRFAAAEGGSCLQVGRRHQHTAGEDEGAEVRLSLFQRYLEDQQAAASQHNWVYVRSCCIEQGQ